jgi:hypothetical protein
MEFRTAYIENPHEDETLTTEHIRIVPWWLVFTHIDCYRTIPWPQELFALSEGRHLGWGTLDPTLLTDSAPGNVLRFPWAGEIHTDSSDMKVTDIPSMAFS